jgi:carboxylesterase type B
MVWIYGGGFMGGSSESKYFYRPSYLMDRDVIIVSFNYRLTVFGFLSTEDDEAPGNYGMHDQTLALKWVQENIAAFGGDPDQVTIFGESAGSISVHMHILSPQSAGMNPYYTTKLPNSQLKI